MRKQALIFSLLLIILLNACSVQQKMNPDIFFERLLSENNDLKAVDTIYDNEKSIYYLKNDKLIDYIFEIGLNNSGDINKISFACNKTDKAEDFIKYMGDIISVYSSDENRDEIIMELTENGRLKPFYSYYETQWYFWSSYSDENGLFFSVINKKLSEHTTAQYSLKQNDRKEF